MLLEHLEIYYWRERGRTGKGRYLIFLFGFYHRRFTDNGRHRVQTRAPLW